MTGNDNVVGVFVAFYAFVIMISIELLAILFIHNPDSDCDFKMSCQVYRPADRGHFFRLSAFQLTRETSELLGTVSVWCLDVDPSYATTGLILIKVSVKDSSINPFQFFFINLVTLQSRNIMFTITLHTKLS